MVPPPGASLATEEAPIISPDGRRLAFVAYDAGGTPLLYTSVIGDAAPARPLLKTAGASLPFWSPDGRAIGFFAQGYLQTVDVTTGGVRKLARAGGPRGGTWNKDGTIVFVPTPIAGPSRVSATGNGDDAKRVPSPSGQPSGGWFPSFLPDGRHFLEFVPTTSQPENSGVWVVSLETGARRSYLMLNRMRSSRPPVICSSGAPAACGPSRSIQTREVRGEPVRGGKGGRPEPGDEPGALFDFQLRHAGVLCGRGRTVGARVGQSKRQRDRESWRDRGVMNTISLSPDAASVVYDSADPRPARSISGSSCSPAATPRSSRSTRPTISFRSGRPDGTRFAFTSVRERPPQLYQQPANSAGTETLLVQNQTADACVRLVARRRAALLHRHGTDTWTGDIWSVSPGSSAPQPVVTTHE